MRGPGLPSQWQAVAGGGSAQQPAVPCWRQAACNSGAAVGVQQRSGRLHTFFMSGQAMPV